MGNLRVKGPRATRMGLAEDRIETVAACLNEMMRGCMQDVCGQKMQFLSDSLATTVATIKSPSLFLYSSLNVKSSGVSDLSHSSTGQSFSARVRNPSLGPRCAERNVAKKKKKKREKLKYRDGREI
ncbi:hypothetical protein PUN28_013690 [Cardiocondyla obscurior]|uniref:Uncharacterized protein n=1 Tax=Cardiocondyla obscurior TaxID=286306 RepID=A0AAW2F2Q6_9HYME